MGFTHYWRREEEIDYNIMKKIVDDFKQLLPEISKAGIALADGDGINEPVIDYNEVWFNGATNCGHRNNENVVIPWPSEDAGGITKEWQEDAKVGNWGLGGVILEKRTCNGNCSYETFSFPGILQPEPWKPPRNGKHSKYCKTAFRPYDIVVTAFLIIAKHYLEDKIEVSSDAKDVHWFDGKMLCQSILGYGFQYQINDEGELLVQSD
jgi:hypothetical protein